MGSPVLAATVGSGLNFSNLTEPVRILLRLNELEVGDQDVCERCLYTVQYVCRFLTALMEATHATHLTIDLYTCISSLHLVIHSSTCLT